MDFQVVIDALQQTLLEILNFVPQLANGLIILVIGLVISLVVRWILRFVLQRLRFDAFVERVGVAKSLTGLGLKISPSVVVAQTVFLFLLLSFLITATRLMGLESVAQTLEQLLRFLPSLIAALVVFLAGTFVAQFSGNVVATITTGAGLDYGERLGRIVQVLVSLFVVILALGVMGIDTALLITVTTILVAAFGLALGLALGLGARQTVHQTLAGYYVRQRFPVGQVIIVNSVEGRITGVGGVNTLITTDEGTVVVPNSTLTEQSVRSPRREAAAPSSPNAPDPRPSDPA